MWLPAGAFEFFFRKTEGRILICKFAKNEREPEFGVLNGQDSSSMLASIPSALLLCCCSSSSSVLRVHGYGAKRMSRHQRS